MYIRMIVLMVVSFYTSRIVLQQLGVDDFGIYNLVGSIVAMFASLRIIFASSTQRYLNYELGQGNAQNLQLVFNLSIYINLLIGVVFVLAVEALGIWFFTHGINIAADRMEAAFIVFQCATLIAAISILTSVFDAVIIAHERMNFYAVIAIVESLMKLGIAYLLSRAPIDKLVFYGLLLVGVSGIIMLINLIYCKWHFSEVKLRLIWDKAYFKQMTQFAGWNFLGNTAYAVTQNGINMVLNVFGGTVVNAARGIAFQVSELTKQFLININTVMTPYSIQAYAGGRHEDFQKAIFISSKILFYVQLMLSIPIIYLTPWLLQLWLGQVPEYSVVFLQLVLCITLVRSVHGPLDTVFKARGELKYYQIAEGIILALPLLLGYLVLKAGAPYASVFVCCIVMEIVNLIIILTLARRIAAFDSRAYTRAILLPAVLCIACAGGLFCWDMQLTPVWQQIILSVASMGLCSALWWGIMLTRDERQHLIALIPKHHVTHRER